MNGYSLEKVPEKKGMSWGSIFWLGIFLLPVAIYFMLNKLHIDTEYYSQNSKKVIGVGLFILLLGILSFCCPFLDNEGEPLVEDIVIFSYLSFVFCVGGYFLLRHGQKYKAMGFDYQKYAPIVLNTKNGSLEQMAHTADEPYEVFCANMQRLIDGEVELLQGSYIDYGKKTLISPLYGVPASRKISLEERVQKSIKTITCPNCGGINTVMEGRKRVCEYCGSFLKLKK